MKREQVFLYRGVILSVVLLLFLTPFLTSQTGIVESRSTRNEMKPAYSF